MQSKDYLEQLAKEHAFEYDLQWWNLRKHPKKANGANGDIVAFYRSHHVFNGVVALWAWDGSHAVLFYTTPHDVLDEKRYGWIPPIFRVEINTNYIYPVPKDGKALDSDGEVAEGPQAPFPSFPTFEPTVAPVNVQEYLNNLNSSLWGTLDTYASSQAVPPIHPLPNIPNNPVEDGNDYDPAEDDLDPVDEFYNLETQEEPTNANSGN